MQPLQVHNFLKRYFIANRCPIDNSNSSYMTVQLTEQIDKLLMHRPFYWHYLEKTGGIPEPMKVTFITDPLQVPDDIKGETVHFGSARLHQLFSSSKKLGSFIRLYEQVHAKNEQSIPLHPWLCINIKISFQCDRKKDVILSLGLNLIHGQIVPQFYSILCTIALTPKIPHFCFTFSPLITVKSGLGRIRKIAQTYIHNEDRTWAEDAIVRMNEDLQLLESFYENDEEKPDSYFVEKEAIKRQYEPHIHVTIINGGLFYLKKQVIKATPTTSPDVK